MKTTARKLVSHKGVLQEVIEAKSIRSREHARLFWPLVSAEDPPRLVVWRKKSFTSDNKLKAREHFAYLPTKYAAISCKETVEKQELDRIRQCHESKEHLRAKQVLRDEIENRIRNGKGLFWYFKDEAVSEFPIGGNLLTGAEAICLEHRMLAPAGLGAHFVLDIAILGAKSGLKKEPIIAAIEIEKTHAFEDRKAMLYKAAGFPIISVDIEDMLLEEITPSWAARILSNTTRSSESGRRFTFCYLNPLLYPLYINIDPLLTSAHPNHFFIVFADDNVLEKLKAWVNEIARMLGIHSRVSVAPFHDTNAQTRKQLENYGLVAGDGWQKINAKRCLSIKLPRPDGNPAIHLAHCIIASLLAKQNSLVGYKWRTYLDTDFDCKVEQNQWHEVIKFRTYVVAPVRLSRPLNLMIEALDALTTAHSSSDQ